MDKKYCAKKCCAYVYKSVIITSKEYLSLDVILQVCKDIKNEYGKGAHFRIVGSAKKISCAKG